MRDFRISKQTIVTFTLDDGKTFSCSQIGSGRFSTCYQDTTNPDIVYFMTKGTDIGKEVLRLAGESTHIPKMIYLGKKEGSTHTYSLYMSEYSETITAKHACWPQFKTLNLHREQAIKRLGVHLRLDRLHELVGTTLELCENDPSLPDTLKNDLDVLESWTSAYGASASWEFAKRNIGVRNGILILRDIVFNAQASCPKG